LLGEGMVPTAMRVGGPNFGDPDFRIGPFPPFWVFECDYA
jgi:hypothetical protein